MRDTPVRRTILSLLGETTRPLSVEEMLPHTKANKTTVYRQLDTLSARGLVRQVYFPDRKIRYELSGRTHHHHLICDRCGAVRDIPLDESALMRQVSHSCDYQITGHYLEFSGICPDCVNH